MKKLFYAHYPALEKQLVAFVKQQRKHPLEKWLIVCASTWMARQLQERLTRELGALANVHFITTGALIGRLDSEAPGETLPLLPQDHVRDFLIKELLGEPGLNRYPLSRGFVQAVKSALRDLADSLVEPDVLEEQLHSMPDFVLQEDGGRLDWLIRLYRRYREQEQALPGYRSYQHAFERALAQVEQSAYLREFSQIVVYGFYDMPGRPLELISRLRQLYPVVVFAPYEKHPAYQFAQKFFETNWLNTPEATDANEAFCGALGASAAQLFSSGGSVPCERVELVSVPDGRGAVFFIAKEMLRLLEQGHTTADMAVIARSVTPYQDEIRRVFAQNGLPLDASFTYPLPKYPLGVFCLNLLSLAHNGFAREQVLSVVASPYFKQPEKAAWKRLISRSAVNRDLAQWNDLLPLMEGCEADIRAWLAAVSRELNALAEAQPWERGVSRVLGFLASQVDEAAFQGKDGEIYQAAREAIAKMETYRAVRAQCHPGELVREVIDALSALTFNEVEQVPGGITVTDAVRARGLSFKTVFLVGLNDREFPQVMQEDPVLRDYYRYIVRDTLGYWINASLDRIDEEKLLFYNAVTAAQEKLYAFVARRGEDGKPAVPSIYAAELARACELNLQAPDAPRVSGRLSERLQACELPLLTSKELSYRLILHPQTAPEAYLRAGLWTDEKERSLAAAEGLRGLGNLNVYDGIIQSGKEIFGRENVRGFSPSALQELGTCPLKYFFDRGMKLGEPDEPASRQDLPADKRGTAYHEVLRQFYESLQDKVHDLFDSALTAQLDQALAKHYTPSSYRAFGIYPVVWEMLLENIRQKLTDFVLQDVKQLGAFTPTYFEMDVTTPPTEDLPLRLRGIIDRVDIDEKAKQFYIVDYKSTRKGTADLAHDIFTHLTLQPFLYVWMARQLEQSRGYTSAGSCLLAIAKYNKRELTPDAFGQVRPRAFHFLMQLADFIKEGTFFINPSDGCMYCPYGMLCRKDAFKPLLRARKSALVVMLEEVRK